MSEEEVQAIRNVYAAIQRRDSDELSQLFTHDVEWSLPETVPWGGTHHGPLGVVALMDVFEDHVEGRWADPEEFLDAGDCVVVLGLFSGTARSSGRPYEVPFVHVWGLTDGVPSSVRAYYDTGPVMAALAG